MVPGRFSKPVEIEVTGSMRFMNIKTSLFSLLLAMLMLSAVEAYSQTDKVQALTEEALRQHIAQIEKATDLDDALRNQVLEFYREALQQAQRASEWRSKAASYQTEGKNASSLIETMRKSLEGTLKEPQVPDKPLAELEQLRIQTEAALAATQSDLAQRDEEFRNRVNRRMEIPNLLRQAQTDLQEINRQLAAIVPAIDENPHLEQARQAQLTAHKQAVEEQINALNQELVHYEARVSLLPLRRDIAERDVRETRALLEALQKKIGELRRREAADAVAETRRDLENAHPVARKIALDNTTLANLRTETAAKVEQTNKTITQVNQRLSQIRDEYKGIQEKVARIGMSNAIGLLLQRKQGELPDIRKRSREARSSQEEIAASQLRLIELQDQRLELSDIDTEVKALVAGVDSATTEKQIRALEEAIRDLVQTNRTLLDSLITEHDRYFAALVDLDTAERLLAAETRAFVEFIKGQVLWVRSAPTLRLGNLTEIVDASVWLLRPRHWAETMETIGSDFMDEPEMVLLGLVCVLALFRIRQKSRSFLQKQSQNEIGEVSDRFVPSLYALGCTLLIASPWPALAALVQMRLSRAAGSTDFVLCVASGLRSIVLPWFLLEFLRQVFRKQGVGECDLGWKPEGTAVLYRRLLWLMALVLPMTFIRGTLTWHDSQIWEDALGRVAFLVSVLTLIVFAVRFLKPSSPLFNDWMTRRKDNAFARTRFIWYPLLVFVPVVLVFLSLAGYHYTAQQLHQRLMLSVILIAGLLFANALALKWLFLIRCRLAKQRAAQAAAIREQSEQTDQHPKDAPKESASAQGESQEPQSETPVSSQATVEQASIGIQTINIQTRRLIRSLFLFSLVMGLWFIWVDMLPALGVLTRIELWTRTVQVPAEAVGAASDATATVGKIVTTSLADLLLALLILVLTFVAGRNIPTLLEAFVFHRLAIDNSICYAIRAVTRYLITITGVIVAFGTLGIGWSQVQWLAAAITVGLGFGLQEIFANFVSGLLILFERPMRVGDVVTVNDVTGTVSRIQIRATTITNWDRKELIVPNKKFITEQLINWTLSDAILRINIPVGLAYGSDTNLARETLLRVAREHPNVLEDPAPIAVFKRFGESSLEFELRVFIGRMDHFLGTSHDLHMAIDKAFREVGIEIAFPQRDLHVRSAKGLASLLGQSGLDIHRKVGK